MLVKGDGPVHRLHRWSSQFYDESSETRASAAPVSPMAAHPHATPVEARPDAPSKAPSGSEPDGIQAPHAPNQNGAE